MVTHYEVLGVDPGADTETIRRAYLVVAKATHPDRRQSEDPGRSARAEQHIRLANEAWNVLRDPVRRAEYDRSLRPTSGSTAEARPTASSSSTPASPVGRPPAPPSGFVVPAAHASLWRYTPIVVVLALLLAILVISAYATSRDTTAPSDTLPRQSVPEVGECVLVRPLANGRVPVPVTCGTQGAYRVAARVDTPRPCPSGTDALPVSGQESTLCLVVAG